ncbi:McrB family protein [Gordonia phosphorivorans]
MDRPSMDRPGAPAVELIGRRFIDEGFGDGESVFTPGRRIWTVEYFQELKKVFVDRPDAGSSDFFSKLDLQLASASSNTIQLFAELFTVNLLPLDDYTPGKKMQLIEKVLAKCRPSVAIPDEVVAALSRGVFGGGVAFKTYRWAQLSVLIELGLEIRSLPAAERERILADPLAFRALVSPTPKESQPAQRQSLLYLAFPDFFLPIVARKDRVAIRDAFASDYLDRLPGDVDVDLHDIYRAMMDAQGGPVDFYNSPWKEIWQPPSAADPEPTDEVTHAWKVYGSGVNGQDMVPIWRRKGTVSLSAKFLREVETGIDKDTLRKIVEDDYRSSSYSVRQDKADEFYAFLNRMHPGDLIVTSSRGSVHIGTVTGEAEHVRSSDGRSNLRRPVSWNTRPISNEEVPKDLATRLASQGEVVDLTSHIDTIRELMGQRRDFTPAKGLNIPDPDDKLAARLHVPVSWLQECVTLLRDRPQLIFYGPPGTGKTYLAKELAGYLVGESNVKIVQFHPAYSYEDFFEGYRPAQKGAGQVGFELRPGPLRRLVDKANESPDATFVLIIDEINRGNLAKIFGELYFLLEYRDEGIDLLYSSADSEPFMLPLNVILLGTMNTADRSIALVDAAMRRRFAFLPLHPAEEPTSSILRSWLREEGHPPEVADLLDQLNALIDDEDFKIGPSYFMRAAVFTDGGLERVWKTSVLPLLEEFHYGDRSVDVSSRYGLDAIRKTVTAQHADRDTDVTDSAGPEADAQDPDDPRTDF